MGVAPNSPPHPRPGVVPSRERAVSAATTTGIAMRSPPVGPCDRRRGSCVKKCLPQLLGGVERLGVRGRRKRYEIHPLSAVHGPAIGVTLKRRAWTGICIRSELKRARRERTTPPPRREPTRWRYSPGVLEGRTTSTPLCAVIRNTDTRSRIQQAPDAGRATPGTLATGARGGGASPGRLTAWSSPLAEPGPGGAGIAVAESRHRRCLTPRPSGPGASWRPGRLGVGGCVLTVEGMPGRGAPDFGQCGGDLSHTFCHPRGGGMAFGAGNPALRRARPTTLPGGGRGAHRHQPHRRLGGITNGMPVEFEVVFPPPRRPLHFQTPGPPDLSAMEGVNPWVLLRALPVTRRPPPPWPPAGAGAGLRST